MSEKQVWERRRRREPGEAIISAISVGAVFILIGLVFVLALPNNLFEKTINFFGSLALRQVPGIGISLPAPISPSAHTVFYTAVFQFSLGIAFLNILTLALRIGFRSHFHKIAEGIGNLASGFGTTYLVYIYLNSSTTTSQWFTFWAAVLVVFGVSLVVRGVALLAKRHAPT
jgi:hypothetical protein